MELKDKISSRRKYLGLTLEDVAKVVGVGKSTVRKWETGYIENMRRDKIAKLADALHTTPAYLMGWEDSPSLPDNVLPLPADPREIDAIYDELNDAGQTELCNYGRYLTTVDLYKAKEKPRRDAPSKVVPLFGASFAAGSPESPGDLFMGDYKTTDLRAEFAIRVNGNSMEPWLPDGSVALGVKRLPRDGEIGAFWLDGGFLVKQVAVDPYGTVYLFALNRDRSDADDEIRPDAGRDLRTIGTILTDARIPLP